MKAPSTNKPGYRNAGHRNKEGLESRLAATALVMLVIDKKASMEDLTDPERGLSAWLKLDARDQALARAIALATLRHRTRINAILNLCWDRTPPRRARFLVSTLETAAAQILFMDVPHSAAVDLATGAIKRERSTNRFSGFANAVLRTLVREREELLAKTASVTLFPPFLAKRLASDHGREKLDLISRAIARPPVLDLQGKPGWPVDPDLMMALPGNAARLTDPRPVNQLPGYAEGQWWVQDIAAAQPVRLLGDVSGKSVIDLCAAPGGKTMQLASVGADVIAVDISARRLDRLRENLERTSLKARIVCTDLLEWEPVAPVDAIILDAPCSATGTVRRHPDILWNTDENDLQILIALQRAMIARVANWLKPGGRLIYANCSLLKEEGENLVASLKLDGLEADPIEAGELPGLEACINGRGQFRSLPHFLTLDNPAMGGMDGFFAARFKKAL